VHSSIFSSHVVSCFQCTSLFAAVYKKMPRVCKYIQSFTQVRSVKSSMESGYLPQQSSACVVTRDRVKNWTSPKSIGLHFLTLKSASNSEFARCELPTYIYIKLFFFTSSLKLGSSYSEIGLFYKPPIVLTAVAALAR
jgi:hypothetical protein